MKFTVKNEFKSGGFWYEVGNTHDSKKCGIPDEKIEKYYEAGFLDIDGKEPGPGLTPNNTTMRVGKTMHVQKAKTVK